MDPVLIVDDEKDNLEALYRLLRNEFTVTTASSPFEALKLVQKQVFHVIVSDQRMAEMNGVELLEKVKNVSPATVRILLTGYTDIDSVIGAINRGNIYRYISKPWDPEDFKLTLRQANEAFQLRRELEKKNIELEKSNQELRLLDRAKARFLSLVSHELNTPLTVVTSFVGLLEGEEKATPEMKKAVKSLSAASSRLSEIVAEVLTFTKIESESKLSLTDFDFGVALKALKPAVEKQFSKKKVTLDLHVREGLSAPCDSEKMTVALRKLLEDAFTRSPEKQVVTIALTRIDQNVQLILDRKGEGISSDALKPLEATSDELHHHRNLGMALAICRAIVEAHGGEMEASGTRVKLRLPSLS